MPKLKRLWVPFTVERWSAAHVWPYPDRQGPWCRIDGVFLALEGDRLAAHAEVLTLASTGPRPRTHAAHKAVLDGFNSNASRHLVWGHWGPFDQSQRFVDADDVRTIIRYNWQAPTDNPGDAEVFDLRAPAARRHTRITDYMRRLFKRLNKQGD